MLWLHALIVFLYAVAACTWVIVYLCITLVNFDDVSICAVLCESWCSHQLQKATLKMLAHMPFV